MPALPLKLCTGPAHPNAVYLPLTDEYWNFRRSDSGYHKKGESYGKCKLCITFMKYGADSGLVDCKPIRPFVQELLYRYDNNYAKMAESVGLSDQALRNILYTKQCSIQRATARKIILALDNKRREDRRNGSVAPAFIHAKRMQERIERMAGY